VHSLRCSGIHLFSGTLLLHFFLPTLVIRCCCWCVDLFPLIYLFYLLLTHSCVHSFRSSRSTLRFVLDSAVRFSFRSFSTTVYLSCSFTFALRLRSYAHVCVRLHFWFTFVWFVDFVFWLLHSIWIPLQFFPLVLFVRFVRSDLILVGPRLPHVACVRSYLIGSRWSRVCVHIALFVDLILIGFAIGFTLDCTFRSLVAFDPFCVLVRLVHSGLLHFYFAFVLASRLPYYVRYVSVRFVDRLRLSLLICYIRSPFVVSSWRCIYSPLRSFHFFTRSTFVLFVHFVLFRFSTVDSQVFRSYVGCLHFFDSRWFALILLIVVHIRSFRCDRFSSLSPIHVLVRYDSGGVRSWFRFVHSGYIPRCSTFVDYVTLRSTFFCIRSILRSLFLCLLFAFPYVVVSVLICFTFCSVRWLLIFLLLFDLLRSVPFVVPVFFFCSLRCFATSFTFVRFFIQSFDLRLRFVFVFILSIPLNLRSIPFCFVTFDSLLFVWRDFRFFFFTFPTFDFYPTTLRSFARYRSPFIRCFVVVVVRLFLFHSIIRFCCSFLTFHFLFFSPLRFLILRFFFCTFRSFSRPLPTFVTFLVWSFCVVRLRLRCILLYVDRYIPFPLLRSRYVLRFYFCVGYVCVDLDSFSTIQFTQLLPTWRIRRSFTRSWFHSFVYLIVTNHSSLFLRCYIRWNLLLPFSFKFCFLPFVPHRFFSRCVVRFVPHVHILVRFCVWLRFLVYVVLVPISYVTLFFFFYSTLPTTLRFILFVPVRLLIPDHGYVTSFVYVPTLFAFWFPTFVWVRLFVPDLDVGAFARYRLLRCCCYVVDRCVASCSPPDLIVPIFFCSRPSGRLRFAIRFYICCTYRWRSLRLYVLIRLRLRFRLFIRYRTCHSFRLFYLLFVFTLPAPVRLRCFAWSTFRFRLRLTWFESIVCTHSVTLLLMIVGWVVPLFCGTLIQLLWFRCCCLHSGYVRSDSTYLPWIIRSVVTVPFYRFGYDRFGCSVVYGLRFVRLRFLVLLLRLPFISFAFSSFSVRFALRFTPFRSTFVLFCVEFLLFTLPRSFVDFLFRLGIRYSFFFFFLIRSRSFALLLICFDFFRCSHPHIPRSFFFCVTLFATVIPTFFFFRFFILRIRFVVDCFRLRSRSFTDHSLFWWMGVVLRYVVLSLLFVSVFFLILFDFVIPFVTISFVTFCSFLPNSFDPLFVSFTLLF